MSSQLAMLSLKLTASKIRELNILKRLTDQRIDLYGVVSNILNDVEVAGVSPFTGQITRRFLNKETPNFKRVYKIKAPFHPPYLDTRHFNFQSVVFA